jgi:hypothetical protein
MRERRADRGGPAETRGENGQAARPAPAVPDPDDLFPDLTELEDP